MKKFKFLLLGVIVFLASCGLAYSATVLFPTQGGTGLDSYTAGDVIYSDATDSLTTRAKGDNGEVLTLVGGFPDWTAAGAGDVTAVYDCASGDCNSMTIESGEYLDGGTATSDATGEGIILPRAADCSAVTGEGEICWDTDGDTLCVGDGAACSVITGGGGGDSVTVNGSAVDTTANFLDGDIDWTLADGGGGGPDDITGTVGCTDCVTLTTETVGNYADGNAEAGDALTGDTATAFFDAGTLEIARGGTGAGSLTNLITLTTHTTGNYAATIADAGNSTITVVNGTAEGGAVTLDAVDLNCNDCLNATEIEDIYLLDDGDVGTGVFDFGGTTSFEITNGAAPTVNAAGEIALDTTADQLKFYGGAERVLTWDKFACTNIEELAAADDGLPLASAPYAIKIVAGWGHCKGTCTTNADIDFKDSDGNAMTMTDFTTSDWGTEPTPQAVSGNNDLIAYEGFSFDVTNAVDPETDTYQICFGYNITAQ